MGTALLPLGQLRLALAAPGLGLLGVQQTPGVPQAGLGLRFVFRVPAERPGLSQLQEPSSPVKRGVSRECSAPDCWV